MDAGQSSLQGRASSRQKLAITPKIAKGWPDRSSVSPFTCLWGQSATRFQRLQNRLAGAPVATPTCSKNHSSHVMLSSPGSGSGCSPGVLPSPCPLCAGHGQHLQQDSPFNATVCRRSVLRIRVPVSVTEEVYFDAFSSCQFLQLRAQGQVFHFQCRPS